MARYAAFLKAGTNNFQTTAEHTNNFVTDFLVDGIVGTFTNTSGVAPMTGNFAVNAQGTPDSTVAVSVGKAYVTVTPGAQASQRIRLWSNATENVTISANATGGTRYDWLYLNVNATNADNPNTPGDNVWTLTTSRSTSSSTDNGTPPTYGLVIAVITVANGFTTITNGNIADKRIQTGSVARALTTAGMATVTPAVTSNPYKFRVNRQAAANTSAGAFARVNFDTKQYDTGTNFDNVTNFRFTAPIAGFYQFNAAVQLSTSSSQGVISLFKNTSTEISRGSRSKANADLLGLAISDCLQLAANDTIEVQVYCNSTLALDVTATAAQNYFSGFLVSAT